MHVGFTVNPSSRRVGMSLYVTGSLADTEGCDEAEAWGGGGESRCRRATSG